MLRGSLLTLATRPAVQRWATASPLARRLARRFVAGETAEEALTVAVIPHTWDHTTVRGWRPGRRVNLEFDLVGKYVVRALERGSGRPEGVPLVPVEPPGGIDRL